MLAPLAVDAARAQRPAAPIRDDVRPGVADREVQAPVAPQHQGVHAVVVVESAEAREEHFLLAGIERVAVAVPVLVDEDRRRARDVHALADALGPRSAGRLARERPRERLHQDPERRDELRPLREHARGIAALVLVGVLEHDHAIALGAAPRARVVPEAVVDGLRHPHASEVVDVERGGVVELRRLGPQLHLELPQHLEVGREVPRGLDEEAERREQHGSGRITPDPRCSLVTIAATVRATA